jgi:hypothetical protein
MFETNPRSPDPDQNPQRHRNEIPISDVMNMDVTTRALTLSSAEKLNESKTKEIVLVDPNFDPGEARFRNVLEIIIERLKAARKTPKRFEIHTSKYRHKDGARIPRVNQSNFKNTLGPILFSDWKLSICAWAENKVEDYQHPRFLLTEIGGIHIDWGLDSGEIGSKTIARGLGEELHQKLFQKYSATGHAFSADSENDNFLVT